MRSIITSMILVSLSAMPLQGAGHTPTQTEIGTLQLSQQKVSAVTGSVKDENGDPVAGCFVFIKGSKTGVSTDIDGNYSISAPEKGKSYILVYQFLGMESQEIKVSEAGRINVTLKADNYLESSVIVGAYGTRQSREDLVGSAFQVNAVELKDKPKARVETLLEGMIPGLTVEANTDAAGSSRTRMNTRVRGDASLAAANEPLWIVDGVVQYTGNSSNMMPGMSYSISPLSYLDPSDIESITVLKDADQVSIYGANGANGVILITTKSGQFGSKLSVSASLRYGVAMPDYSTMFKMMNAEQYMTVAREAWQNASYKMVDFPFQDNEYNSYSITSTFWPDVYFGLGSDLYAQVSIRSGSSKSSKSVSLSYYDNKNIIQSDRSQRFSLRTKNQYKLGDKATFSIGMNGSYNINNLFTLGKGAYLETLPVYSPYMDDGYTLRLYNRIWDMNKGDWVMRKFYSNEVPDRELNDNIQTTAETSANASFSWTIIEGLSFESNASFSFRASHEDMYHSRETLDGIDDNGVKLGYSSRRDASYVRYTNSEILRYKHKFAQRHSLELYGGMELQGQTNKYSYISGSGFTNDHIKELEYASTISQGSYTNVNPSRQMSYFARGQYSFDSRYYLSANVRFDGSSIFGKYSRWGKFGSVGASWNIHKEPWFQSDLVKMLKLKGSLGLTGNSRVDGTVAAGTYTYSDSYSYMNVAGAVLGSMPNPGLSWETTLQKNIGVRLELRDILDVEVEYYNNDTYDLISKIYVSRTISDDRLYANVGSIRNSGIELSLTTHNFHTSNFSWNTSLNASHNGNKITKLYNGMVTSFGSTVWKEGCAKDEWCLIRWAGVDPSDGAPMWYDKDGNITKSYSYDNRVTGKSPNPIVFGGLSNDLHWKNLSLSFQISYGIGGYAYCTYAHNYMEDGYDITSGNQAVEVYLDRWTTPGQNARAPKVSVLTQHSFSYTDRFLYKKTFFDLKNVSLGWSVPSRLCDRMGIRGIDLSLICDNAYLFTPDQSRTRNSYKTMRSGYPVTRTISLGINLSL